MEKVVIYLRVSTDKQETENQLIPLKEYANKMNYEIVNVYKDEGISGSKGRDQRPQLDEMLKAANKNQFSKILCYDISRLGRSLKDLVNILNDLNVMKIDMYFFTQGIDTSTSQGKTMFQLMGVFAEYERQIIIARVNSGLLRAKEQGKKLGRPTSINQSLISAVKMLREKGIGIRKIATELQIGIGTTMKILNQLNKPNWLPETQSEKLKKELYDEKYNVPVISQAM